MAKHKTLVSVVHNTVHSFASLMNYVGDDYVLGHIVQAAWATGATELRVDLMTGATNASPLLVPEVRYSVARAVEWFPDHVARSKSSLDFIAEAELLVRVDPNTRRPSPHPGLLESPFICSARITDDRGKVYLHEIRDWWYPEKVPPTPAIRWNSPGKKLLLSVGVMIAALPYVHLSHWAAGGSLVAFLLSILFCMDLATELRAAENPSTLQRVLGILLSTPKVLFGLCAVGFGIALAAWILYNVFGERQVEFEMQDWTSVAIVPVMIGVGIHWIVGPFRRQPG
ncbi:MAG: hypothetical protein GC161_04675 [Planctomycetaceae bacterium]|nr:hypothetical protein [Planctomycetaceae bacterium]